MKGYKFLTQKLEAPYMGNFTYELGKWYKVEDENEIEVCEYGFHFLKNIRDVFAYAAPINIVTFDLYEIEARGKIIHWDNGEDDKYCSSKIKIVKKLKREDIIEYIEENKLLYSDNPNIRGAIARYGYGLDILINDECSYVRMNLARGGYELDKLINDEEWYVRNAVAEQGYGLDILVKDIHPVVRETAINTIIK